MLVNKEGKQIIATNETVSACLNRLSALLVPDNPALQSFGTWSDISGRNVQELVQARKDAERLICEGYELLAALPIVGEYPDFARLEKKPDPSLEDCLNFLLYYLRMGVRTMPYFFSCWKDGTACRFCRMALSRLDGYDLTETESACWIEQSSTGRTITPSGELLSIGRSKRQQPDQQIWTIDNALVSRVHAQVIRKNGTDKYFIRDCGSVNGSFLNGEKLSPDKPQPLSDRDCFNLADEEFIFHQSRRYKQKTMPLLHDMVLDR